MSRTLSKAFGLAGMRIGYAVAAPSTVSEVEKARGPYKVGRLAGAAGAAALADEEGWVTRTVAECVANRTRAEEMLAARGLGPLPSSANFILFRAPSGDAIRDALAVRAKGVAVRPFPGDMPDGADALRLTVAPWPLMARFFEALDAYLAEPMNVALFDYGAGNLHSLGKALERAGATVRVTRRLGRGARTGRPRPSRRRGVRRRRGRACRRTGRRCGGRSRRGFPCLGICLGMQLLFDGQRGVRGIRHRRWCRDASCGCAPPWSPRWGGTTSRRRTTRSSTARSPWSRTTPTRSCAQPDDPGDAIAWSEYGGVRFAAAVRRARTWGVQFHPEKSSARGRILLANWVALAGGRR